MKSRSHLTLALILTVVGLSGRLVLAFCLPNDDDDDGRYYSQIATNVATGHGYSGETEAPYLPTCVRVPGYPLFLAGAYRLFGVENKSAIRIIHSFLDTCTCWVVALLSGVWSPRHWMADRRRNARLIALAIAVLCPFTAIYVTTLLSETLAIFLATSFVLVASQALKFDETRRSLPCWLAAGVLGGAATMTRPDVALFVTAAGLTLIINVLVGDRGSSEERETNANPGWRYTRRLKRAVACVAVMFVAFSAVLAPWTIRNARVFGVFQPVAPLYANQPDEFVPIGYITWLRTWVDDERYVSPFEDALDLYPIMPEALPVKAFDSIEEKGRVWRLLDSYNHPQPEPINQEDKSSNEPEEDRPLPDASDEAPHDAAEEYQVRMTPEIDAAFAQLARERIERHPVRYYAFLPIHRAVSIWFDTHSQYYPFQGELFPLYDLDTEKKQQYWLTLFAVLIGALTVCAPGGLIVVRRDRKLVVFIALLVLLRLLFLGWQEHPETRYTAEFFPLAIAAASLMLASVRSRNRIKDKAE